MIIISNVSKRVDEDFSSEIEVRKGKKKKKVINTIIHLLKIPKP